MAHDVFVSYAAQDKTIANAVVAALETAKIRCWIAPRDIFSGENWAEAITKAIKASRVMILLFTESSNQSKQVAKELTLAVNSEVIVVPFKIDDTLPRGVMEYYLSDTHWLDAMNPPTEKQINNLMETVKYILGDKKTIPPTSDDDQAAAPPIPARQIGKTRPASAGKKKEGLIIVSILVAGLLLLGGIYFSGIFIMGEVAGDEDVESDEVALEQEEIIVARTEDSGEGTLRKALEAAVAGDVITFDIEVFSPNNPATIYVMSPLPSIAQGNLTIDASDAGVILDGSRASIGHLNCLVIESSDNVLMGLQIVNFMGYAETKLHNAGILLGGSSATNNTIGGDRTVGAGPIGQGNLSSGNDVGIDIQRGAADNVITGNLVGTDASGNNAFSHYGNDHGFIVDGGSSDNMIGPDNIIAFNRWGIQIYNHEDDEETTGNTVTRNSIHSNYFTEIDLGNGGNLELPAPRITYSRKEEGVVRGTAPPGSTVEIFSDSGGGGEIYEGSTEADESGNFNFSKPLPLWGPNITATATDPDGNTSEFSNPDW